MSTWAILLAGGSGTRMGASANKTLIPLLGECALCRALRTLRRHCDGAVIVLRPQDEADIRQALANSGLSAEAFAYGGYDRQESVKNGLALLPPDCDIVLVHDGARPLTDDATVENVIDSVKRCGSGIASTPVTDTIKVVNTDDMIESTPPRAQLCAVQTPQVFERELYAFALENAGSKLDSVTDDCSLIEQMGGEVMVVEGSKENIKLTTPLDILIAESILNSRAEV